MMRVSTLRRIAFAGTTRRFVRQMTTTTAASVIPEATAKKKKKLSELTPQEIEVEMSENLVKLRKSFERDELENSVVPIFKKAILYADQVAVKDSGGEYSYIRMYISAKRLAIQISNLCGSASMKNVGYLCANNILSPLAQWACWISGQVAMPLSMCNSSDALRALLIDSKASLLITTPDFENIGKELTEKLDIPLLVIDKSFLAPATTTLLSVPRVLISACDSVLVEGTFSNDFYSKANAMLLYTPGTTGKAKGVMISHKNLNAQVQSLIKAWKCDANDCLMHALPLNHVHNCLNAFLGAFSVGGRIVLHDQFNSHNVWSTLLGINTPVKDRVNVFMAVPAVYNLLIAEYEKSLTKNIKMVEYISNYCKENVRLMVSGSTPLPPTVFRRWREITGHSILEYYGATEFGLALSNPYDDQQVNGESRRQAGVVGMPLPDVHVRLIGSNDQILVDCKGELSEGVWKTKFMELCSVENEPKENSQEDKSLNESRAIKIDVDVDKTLKCEETKPSLTETLISTASKLMENFIHPIMSNEPLKTVVQKSTESTEAKIQTEESGVRNENIPTDTEGIFATPLVTDLKASITPTPPNAATQKEPLDDCQATLEPGPLLGELQVAGPQVFRAYYGNSDATVNAFTGDFFKTGDIAIFQDGAFKILGRTNVDVIEIAGRKISSYDIESLILEHPSIRDVTVVTMPEEGPTSPEEEEGGQQSSTKAPSESLGVVCVLNQEAKLDLKALNIFCAKSLPKYLLPKKLKIVEELPRSNMAKINKKALRELLLCKEKTAKASEP